MNNKLYLKNAKMVLPSGVVYGNMIVEDGAIIDIKKTSIDPGNAEVYDVKGRYVLPGCIDLHTNGIAGFDLTNGVYNIEHDQFSRRPDEYAEGLEKALLSYVNTGATMVYLSSLAAPADQLKMIFSFIRDYMENNSGTKVRSVFGGLYIEGTFIKNADNRGGHNAKFFYQPSIELFDSLQEAAGGKIAIVNIPSEWNEPAFQLIEYLVANGVVSATGHTGATGDQCEEAIRKGVRLAVHLLNGPNSSSAKSLYGGGAVEAILRNNEIFVELILDGYHVDKSYVLDVIKRKGIGKIAGITDSMFAANLNHLRKFEICGVRGAVSSNGEYMQIVDRPHTLMGSRLTMDVAFSNLLTWLTTPIKGVWYEQHDPLDFDDAIVCTSAVFSGNPAKIMGIDKSSINTQYGKGSIEMGKAADLIIADIDRKNERFKLNIEKVLLAGIFIDNCSTKT